jgi:hypothetical protein
MNPLLNDDELAEAVRRLEVTDPLPDIDPATMLDRGRRGVRRRRLLASGGTAVVVAAVAVSAAILPDLGSADGPPAATSPAPTKTRAATPTFLEPMPGVPRGEAALAVVGKAEVTRRCEIRNPGRGALENAVKGAYRGGLSLPYVTPPQTVDLPGLCAVPGDSRPTAAGLAVLRSNPLPRDNAGLLRNCSIDLWHDLRSWQIVAKDAAPGLVTSLVALSPSGKYVAHCRSTADGSDGGSGAAIYPTHVDPGGRPVPSAMDQLQYLGGQGTACPVFGARCTGWVAYESGRTDPKVAKLRFTSKNGRAHDVTVRDGWYALAWNDTAPGTGPGGQMTAYDKHGKVIFQR